MSIKTGEEHYYLLVRRQPYQDLGGDYFDKRRPAPIAKRLVARLERLGYQVSLAGREGEPVGEPA